MKNKTSRSAFFKMIPNYDRIFRRNSTTYAEYYFHEDRNATSPLMDNLLISFYWRNLIRSDLISDFQRWSSLSYEEHDGNSTPAPDIVVIGLVFLVQVFSSRVDFVRLLYTNIYRCHMSSLEHQ